MPNVAEFPIHAREDAGGIVVEIRGVAVTVEVRLRAISLRPDAPLARLAAETLPQPAERRFANMAAVVEEKACAGGVNLPRQLIERVLRAGMSSVSTAS